MTKVLCLWAGVLFTSTLAFAQGGGPLGGSVRSVVIDPTNPAVVYVGTVTGGVFKSTNGGSTWASVNTTIFSRFVNDLALDPSQPGTIYAATSGVNGGIFKSTDGGTSWNPANTGLSDLAILSVTIDPNNPSVLYAGNNGGIFKSTNGAGSWVAANTGLASTLTVRDVAVDAANSNVLYAATFSGAFKSINGGASWTAVNTGISVLSGTARPGAFGVAIDPSDSATVYVTTQSEGGVFKTTNGGSAWTALNSGLTAVQVSALVVHPSSSVVYAATTSNAVYKSTDHGATWLESNLGFTTLPTTSLVMDPTTPTTLYAGTRNIRMNNGRSSRPLTAVRTGPAQALGSLSPS